LGKRDQAVDQLQSAVSDLRDAKLDRSTKELQALHVEVYVRLASLNIALHELENARGSLDDASRWVDLLIADAANESSVVVLPSYFIARANLSRMVGQTDEAVDWLRRGLEQIQTSDSETKPSVIEAKAMLSERLSEVVFGKQRISVLEDAVRLRRELLGLNPGHLTDQYLLGSAIRDLAFEAFRDQPDSALSLFEEAESLLGELHVGNPKVNDYRKALARTLDLHGYALHQIGGTSPDQLRETYFQKSLRCYRRSAELCGASVENQASMDLSSVRQDDLTLVSMVCNGLALVYRDQRVLEPMKIRYRDALRIQRMLADARPNESRPALDICGTQLNLGRSLMALGDIEGGLISHQEAIQRVRELRQLFPNDDEILKWNLKMACSLHECLLNHATVGMFIEHQIDTHSLGEEVEKALGARTREYHEAVLFRALVQLAQSSLDEYRVVHETNTDIRFYDFDTARFIGKIHQWLADKKSLPDDQLDQIITWAYDLMQRVAATEGWSYDELLKQDGFPYIDQQYKARTGASAPD
ncbi:MAG: hypothetical protein AAF664_14985, partial [Planctomycetota bacterium]